MGKDPGARAFIFQRKNMKTVRLDPTAGMK